MTTAAPAPPKVVVLDLSSFEPSELNPRTSKKDPGNLMDLIRSIIEHGEIIQPLLVRTKKGHRNVYEIIDGERRYYAGQEAKMTSAPAVVRDDLTDAQALDIMLLSSIQKRALTPLEEAAGFKRLMELDASFYTLDVVANRMGLTTRQVWDRMKLLDLMPLLRELLDQDRLPVRHAELLARETPEVQEKIAAPNGGLWVHEGETLPFEGLDKNDIYAGLKVVSLRELEAHIAKRVRAKPQQLAVAAPLEFGPVSDVIEQALAQPGRGKKVISITFDHSVHPDAKDAEDRTYGPRSWKLADGTKKTTEVGVGKFVDSPECDHSVIGYVVTWIHRGEAFKVCIATDKCEVHWKKEIKAREKNAELRAKGHGSKAAQNEAQDQQRQREEDAARDARRKEWQDLTPHLLAEIVSQTKGIKTLTDMQARYFDRVNFWNLHSNAKDLLGPKWFKTPAAALVAFAATRFNIHGGSFQQYVKETAKPLGLDIAKLEIVRDKHQAKTDTPKASPKKSAPKSARKAKK